MKFVDQYKSPKWQKLRLEILERDGFECTCCGDSYNQLHVHHYRYRRGAKVWEYDSDELTTLCGSCHEEYHRQKEKIDSLIHNANCTAFPYLKGFISACHSLSPRFDEQGCGPEGIEGKILGRLVASPIMRILVDTVMKDREDGSLDEFGDSDKLHCHFLSMLRAIKNG